MSSKRWLICFTVILALILSTLAAYNLYADPFGVFGDPNFDWYAANMTNNPATAKIAYIDRHHTQYDSYIVGSSGTSYYPVEKLNEYTGANFFNLFSYGGDMYKTYLMAKYVIERYETKNLVVCLSISDAINYKSYGSTVTETLHKNITGEFPLSFYAKYLYANPKYARAKIDYKENYDRYLPLFFDVFDTSTGAYDDRVVNIEHIGSLEEYLEREKYSELKEENRRTYTPYLPRIDECVWRLADLKSMCEERDINFSVIFNPYHYSYCGQQDWNQIATFYRLIAGVCDFWDFMLSPASLEPRYFQDYLHIRTSLGAMALAKVYGAQDTYIPDDFGHFITAENVYDYTVSMPQRYADLLPEPGRSSQLEVILYHNIREGRASDNEISPDRFDEHIAALAAAGYNAVTLQDLLDFVERGAPLPDNPILITFDDGYESNYEYAYPILEKHGMRATIFVVGSGIGNADGDLAHFGWNEALEMSGSGVIEIGSHSYSMHLYPRPEEPGPETGRDGMGKYGAESEDEYIAALRADISAFNEAYSRNMGELPAALAFPYGVYTQLTEAILVEYGYKVTFTTMPGRNEILKGLPQTLYGLNRYTISGELTGDELIELLSTG
ncbi:MAG: polysaccharide deacetylase family protein [Oscillospiraceae bacterium]|nr:polysaccharide deacetylase family protein [Oscillospiraceae bacterium]